MTLDELYKIKDNLSKKMSKMTSDEIIAHHKKVTEQFFERAGRENFTPTDKPNVWMHKAKKAGSA